MRAPGRGSRTLPILAFATCSAVWSSTFLFIRIGNDTVPAVWAATLRLVLASLLLGAIGLAGRQPWPRGAALRAALGFGVLEFGVSLPLLYWGEKAVPSGIAAILFATLPLLSAAFARAAGLEPLRPLKLVAALVALGGVALLVSGEVQGRLPALPLLAVFLAAATAALAGVLLKRAPQGSPIVTNAIAHAVGVPFCLAASAALHEPLALPAGASAWLPIAYLTLAGSVVAFVTFTWLVQRWSVVRVSFISVVTPVLAAGLGAVVRHERLGATVVLGGAVVLAGLALAIASDARARG